PRPRAPGGWPGGGSRAAAAARDCQRSPPARSVFRAGYATHDPRRRWRRGSPLPGALPGVGARRPFGRPCARAASQDVMTVFSYSGTELKALAGAHNYYRWIFRRFAPYLGPRIVEVGAGVGTFSRLLLDESGPSRLVLVEPADNLAPLLRSRFD